MIDVIITNIIILIFLVIIIFLLLRLSPPRKESYEYGWCCGTHARRHIKTKELQFLLWKPGEQGWTRGCWYRLGDGRTHDFIDWGEGNLASVPQSNIITKKQNK
jgi:hypothetical protein